MTEAELTATIRTAVRDAIADGHVCRFTDREAAAVHQIGGTLNPDQLDALRYTARWVAALGSRLGQLLVVLVLGILVAGLAMALGLRFPPAR